MLAWLSKLYNNFMGYDNELVNAQPLTSFDRFKWLLEERNPNVNYIGDYTPLMAAGQSNDYEKRIRLLLIKGADLNLQMGVFKNTALHYYIANEEFGIVDCILKLSKEYGKNIDLSLQDTLSCTPILLAAKMGKEKLTLSLLEYAQETRQALNLSLLDGRQFNLVDYALLFGMNHLYQKLITLGIKGNVLQESDVKRFSKIKSKNNEKQTVSEVLVRNILSHIVIAPDRAKNAKSNKFLISLWHAKKICVHFLSHIQLDNLSQKNKINDELISRLQKKEIDFWAHRRDSSEPLDKEEVRELFINEYKQLSRKSLVKRHLQSQSRLIASCEVSEPKKREKRSSRMTHSHRLPSAVFLR